MKSNTSGPELGSVIVGVDGSEPARWAALWASDEAARRRRPLHIVYGSDVDGRVLGLSNEDMERVRAAGRELLAGTAEAVQARHPALSVTTEFSRSGPAMSLRLAASTRGTLVVGNRGRAGFSSLALGSVGLKVAAEARTPVIVVRGSEDEPLHGVVLAAVRDERDLDCVRHAARAAELRKASLRLLHVQGVLEYVGSAARALDGLDKDAGRPAQALAAVAERIREEYPSLTVHADAEKSVSVAGVLVEASRHADLLVIGGRRSPGHIGHTLGRVTHSLVHHAHCPVELIPRHGDEHRSEAS
ncbi:MULTISPECIES: universal stress protein [unclassified Streptomyces]|uniref:universal stress protein n=1 Tax=unclassified Streptomyces TaxID=2593676 RepID=UPI000DC7583D|nr:MULTISPECIES: universal stress protein [unclassified Streptomyces]AWZ03482.1 universal stress protein [Streptomyces sp. ICC4]AWZ11244.1 universal stress protein [Streptomyces sp. ICC1]